MSRRARTRMQHPRRAAVNTVQMAINGTQKLSDRDIAQQIALVRHAVAEFARGTNSAHHWVSLADTANIAETLADMRLGGGPDAQALIERAQQALHDVYRRQAAGGTWVPHADEIDALLWLAPLHEVQLDACSYRQFETAYRRTAQRMAQALAGNAAPGARVIVGQIDSTAAPAAAGA